MLNLTGQKYHRLTVLRLHGKKQCKDREHYNWECQCECGKITYVITKNLRNGKTKSCGCLRGIGHKPGVALSNKRRTKHGMCDHPGYESWRQMKSRCTNPNATGYEYYGGLGVTYDPEWEEFESFWADMKDSWEPGLTIERKNPYGNYCKSNCKWATWKEQANNKRKNYKGSIGE